jgi:hypothetical protein
MAIRYRGHKGTCHYCAAPVEYVFPEWQHTGTGDVFCGTAAPYYVALPTWEAAESRLAFLRYEHETCIRAARSNGRLSAMHLNRAAESRRNLAALKVAENV